MTATLDLALGRLLVQPDDPDVVAACMEGRALAEPLPLNVYERTIQLSSEPTVCEPDAHTSGDRLVIALDVLGVAVDAYEGETGDRRPSPTDDTVEAPPLPDDAEPIEDEDRYSDILPPDVDRPEGAPA